MMSSQLPPAPPEPVAELCGQSPVTSLTFGQLELEGLLRCATLFSGHQDGKIIEWNLTNRRPVTSWKGHTASIQWLKWTTDKLLSQGRDGAVRIWSHLQTTDMTCLGEIRSASLTFCNSAICQRESDYILTVPSDNTAEVNVHLLKKSSLPPEDTSVRTTPASDSSGLSRDTCSIDKSQKSLTETTFVHVLKPTPVQQYAMCMKMCSFHNKSGQARLLVSHESGSLLLWDVMKRIVLSEVKAHEESVMCMNVWSDSSNGPAKCVTGSVNSTLKSWHVVDDKISAHTTVSVTNPGFSDLAIRTDGRIFASGGWDSMGRVFTLSKLRPLAVLSYHRGSVQSVAFAMDKTLATGSKDGYIAMWKLYTDR